MELIIARVLVGLGNLNFKFVGGSDLAEPGGNIVGKRLLLWMT